MGFNPLCYKNTLYNGLKPIGLCAFISVLILNTTSPKFSVISTEAFETDYLNQADYKVDMATPVRGASGNGEEEPTEEDLKRFDWTTKTYIFKIIRPNVSGNIAGIKLEEAQLDADAQIDIVAHSMGGLVSRSLIELEHYPIRNLVMFGTPNGGTDLYNIFDF